MIIPDPITELAKPGIDALYQISNPILIILLVILLIAIVLLSYGIYRMDARSKLREDKKEEAYKLELKDKEKQLDEVYALMHKDSKTSLEFMLTLENKFGDYIKTSREVGSDVKGLLVIVNTLKIQIEFMLKK